MSGRRPLHETLSEIANGLVEAVAIAPLRTPSLELDLPLDIRLPSGDVQGDSDLTGDLPLFRLRTAFDPEPARLHIVFGEAPQ